MLRTITKATSNDLTTVQAVRLELGNSATSADDALIVSLISQASAMLAGEMNRAAGIEEIEQIEQVRAPLSFFLLDRWPVTELVSCTVAGATIALTDLRLDPHEGFVTLVRNGVTLSWPLGQTVIRYKAGYVLAGAGRNVPADLERAAIGIAKALFYGRDRDPNIRSDTVAGVGATSYTDTERLEVIGPDARAIINRYRLPMVA